nr:uncharacterized protein LOC105863884 isoform X7 [Microcebus murinus]
MEAITTLTHLIMETIRDHLHMEAITTLTHLIMETIRDHLHMEAITILLHLIMETIRDHLHMEDTTILLALLLLERPKDHHHHLLLEHLKGHHHHLLQKTLPKTSHPNNLNFSDRVNKKTTVFQEALTLEQCDHNSNLDIPIK